MVSKFIVVIMVLLLIITGGIGYYSYTLNEQIDRLDERLAVFEAQQKARVEVMGDELIALRSSLTTGFSTLEGRIEFSNAEIDALERALGQAEARISSAEEEIGGVTSQVEDLDSRIAGAESSFAQTMIDASEVYQKVSRATVRISNGSSTVGSGFILDTEGHVVTAYHVIDAINDIFVILYDGRVSRATTVGFSEFSDVAVLKLEDNPAIEPPPLADSSLVRIGEPVIAIGSPLELRDTLTAGIISQVNRFAEISYNGGDRAVPNLLQFDAAVNAGNSGCPLINADGEIIGLVIARIFPTEGDGIYYAVASNKVKRVVAAVLATGKFDYPWIGVGITNLTPRMVEERSLETANGVLVVNVFSGGPAQAAGVQTDDIIVAIDGVPVRDTADLTSYLGEFNSPGDTTVLDILRGPTRTEITVEIGTRE